jgi:hypothetical protein
VTILFKIPAHKHADTALYAIRYFVLGDVRLAAAAREARVVDPEDGSACACSVERFMAEAGAPSKAVEEDDMPMQTLQGQSCADPLDQKIQENWQGSW